MYPQETRNKKKKNSKKRKGVIFTFSEDEGLDEEDIGRFASTTAHVDILLTNVLLSKH